VIDCSKNVDFAVRS